MGPFGRNEDDDDEQNGLTNALVYGNRMPGQGEQSAPKAADLPGPQPSQGNYSTKETSAPPIPSTTTSHSMESREDDDLKPPTYSPSAVPTVPNANLDQYQKFEQQLQAPAPDRNDPLLKPKWYDQVRGRLAAGMMAFGGDPRAAIEAGSNVINRRFNDATSNYQNQQSAARQGLAALRDQSDAANQDFERQMQLHNAGLSEYNTQERAYQGQVTARDRQAQEQQRLQGIAPGTEAPDDPTNPTGGWHANTIGGQTMKLQGPPDAWMKTPAGTQAVRDQYIKTHNLTGDDAKFYSANGKLREPSQAIHIHNPSGSEEEWNSYVKSLGHPPTTDDVLRYHHGGGTSNQTIGKARLDMIENDKQKALDRARKDLKSGGTMDDFLDDWQNAQDNYESRLKDATGHDIDHLTIRDHVDKQGRWVGGGGTPQAAQPQKAPPQAQNSPVAPPHSSGKQLDANTARQFLQQAGGDKQKARQLAQQKGFSF